MTIQETIRKLSGATPAAQFLLATVVRVDANLADLDPLDGSAQILDARLMVQDGDGLLLTPKIGSLVGCLIQGGIASIVLYSELSKVEYKFAGQKATIDQQKLSVDGFFALSSQSSDLKSCINELIDFIIALQVVNPIVGNSILLPAQIPQLQSLKAKFNTFLA